MTQEERWMKRYDEVVEFVKNNKRNPSRHRIEEHLLLNFVKHNRKLMNKGELNPDRIDKFLELLGLMEQNRHINQYV
jgi:hypothetical protein